MATYSASGADLSGSIDLPALDDEPSYLEAGLWEHALDWPEVDAARDLNRTIRIVAGRVRVTDPVTGIESEFGLGDELRTMLHGLSTDSDRVEALSPALRERLVALGILENRRDASKRHRARRIFLAKVRQQFAQRGYVNLPRLLSPVHLAWLRCRYRRHVREAALAYGDSQCPTRWIAHNEPAARIIHPLLTELVSEVAGSRVKASYVYLGCYEAGSALPEHTDREQCEFSITMLVDYLPEPIGESPWPIYLRVAGEPVAIRQRIGDALLYRGRRLPHYRNALAEGQMSTSLFFHFVPEEFEGKLE